MQAVLVSKIAKHEWPWSVRLRLVTKYKKWQWMTRFFTANIFIYSLREANGKWLPDWNLKVQNSLFDTGAQVSYISHSCCLMLSIEPKIDIKGWAKVNFADRSNLGSMGITIYSVTLSLCGFDCKFIVHENFLWSVSLGLNFAKCFKVAIYWNSHSQLYLHQDCKPLPSVWVNPKENMVNTLILD